MLNDSFAPIRRASIFFGFMAISVAALTYGADLQLQNDQSSTTVAMSRSAHPGPLATGFAMTEPQPLTSSLQARLEAPSTSVMR